MITITVSNVPSDVFVAIASSGTRRGLTVDEEVLRILIRVFGRGLRQAQIDWADRQASDRSGLPPVRAPVTAVLRTLREERDRQVLNEITGGP